MIRDRIFAIVLAAAAVALAGCATSRSEVRLTAPPASPVPQATSANASAPSVYIRSVKDERSFEQAPKQPSTPSLGFEGVAKATAEAKLRAIGRKRNAYGMALGDVFLQEGQTVESVIRENLAAALREAGYNVRSEASAAQPTLVIDVSIKKFWAWLNPGFWAVTVSTDIATDLTFSMAPDAATVAVHVEDGRAIVTDSAWLETVDKALQSYRREAVQKMSGRK